VETQRDFSKYALSPDELRKRQEELQRLNDTRDQIVKALKSAALRPEQRDRLKNTLPLYEQKIRSLREQIIASELLGNLNPDEVSIPSHYQDRKR
jgi:septal ring factor EnvC (AmiA/AmiB activator)